jgi:hypothetical protein
MAAEQIDDFVCLAVLRAQVGAEHISTNFW